MTQPKRDSRNWAERERDELHRLLIFIRGVESEPNFSETLKGEMTYMQYARVAWINSLAHERKYYPMVEPPATIIE